MKFSTSISFPALFLFASINIPSPVSAFRNPLSNRHSNSHPHHRNHVDNYNYIVKKDEGSNVSREDGVVVVVSERDAVAEGPTAEDMYERALTNVVTRSGGDIESALGEMKRSKYIRRRSQINQRRQGGGAGGGATCQIHQAAAGATTVSSSSSSSAATWTASSSTTSSSSSAPAWTPSSSASSSAAWQPATTAWTTSSSSSAPAWTPTTSSSSAAWSAPSASSSSSAWSATGIQQALAQNSSTDGLLDIWDPTCGHSGATAQYPNGSPTWLACGLTSGGWTPPAFTMSQVIGRSLNTMDKAPTPDLFSSCNSQSMGWFDSIGQARNIPGIMLAAIAMQETGCDNSKTGANGEIGMMQITPQNCIDNLGSAAACWDPYQNIDLAAKLLTASSGNNVAEVVGGYNGWYKGMTSWGVEAFRPCTQQQNLDYLNALFNGWLQGIRPDSTLNTYNNVQKCQNGW